MASKHKILLAINAGSSSVKISVFTSAQSSDSPTQFLEAQISGLTAPPAKLSFYRIGTPEKNIKDHEVSDVKSQDDAFKYMLDYLIGHSDVPEISKREDITHTCHRVVHGGEYAYPVVISPETVHHLERLSDLAPLHNSPALSIIHSCTTLLSASTKHIAFFDSSFHHSLPEHIYTYPISPEIAKKNGLRKYGFHGLSYSFITRSVARFFEKEEDETNLIVLHLGSGASACVIRGGKSLDTSMGLTPLAGLPGATRSGSIDPSLVFHYTSDAAKLSPSNTKEMHISTAEEILNKQCGWKSLTGTTDFGRIAASDDKAYKLAFDIFVDRICAYVGSYFVQLNGNLDALVFAGGIGEKSAKLRQAVVEKCECIGFVADEKRNEEVGSVEGAVVQIGGRVLVCRTDEQFEMARQCVNDRELWGA